MRTSQTNFFNLFFLLLLLRSATAQSPSADAAPPPPSALHRLPLDGHFSFHDVSHAARDFGNRYRSLPSAVLHPRSASDVAAAVRHVFQLGPHSRLTVAARGHGHSLQGQSQAPDGVVVRMGSLRGPGSTRVRAGGERPYAEASGGALWIDVLQECLRHGLAPKSWTDYLHLTVGGTLSNAGVSGQAFRHGPQISNVDQLEVVTGRGDVINCSRTENSDLFFGVLGGLGQFGIITRARIPLEPAPKMVKWIRVLYSDITSFTEDQEMLISAKKTFDYIEGFVIINRTGILNSWRSSFNPQDPAQASQFVSNGRTLYCLEMTKNFNPDDIDVANQEVYELLSRLRYMKNTLFQSEVSYLEFLDRVHASEVKLRAKGLWDVPHPWLNLLIPRSKIHEFAKEVFGKILTDSSNGPILIYPVNKSRWDNSTSFVTPDSEVFYFVAFLPSASPSDHDSLETALRQNERILDFCREAGIGMKQYLPHYTTQEQWREHFGAGWEAFLRRKQAYDPLAILAPGQRIFQKVVLSS